MVMIMVRMVWGIIVTGDVDSDENNNMNSNREIEFQTSK